MYTNKRLSGDTQLRESVQSLQVTRGKEYLVVEGIRNIFAIPAKLVLWNARVGLGALHENSLTALKVALVDGGATSTHISINEYNPILIWQRTFSNDKTSMLTKVTLGTIVALHYTFFPNKLLYISDHYNQFADSICLYSDSLEIALHEAGHAIDVTEKSEKNIGPGLYTLASFFPPVHLYQEVVATRKALRFISDHESRRCLRGAFALLFPAFATHLAGQIINSIDLANSWGILTEPTSPRMRFYIFFWLVVVAHIVGRAVGNFAVTSVKQVHTSINN